MCYMYMYLHGCVHRINLSLYSSVKALLFANDGIENLTLFQIYYNV